MWTAEGGKTVLYDKNTRLLKPMADLQPDSGPTMVEGSKKSLDCFEKSGGGDACVDTWWTIQFQFARN